jgi:hypothetical protein
VEVLVKLEVASDALGENFLSEKLEKFFALVVGSFPLVLSSKRASSG